MAATVTVPQCASDSARCFVIPASRGQMPSTAVVSRRTYLGRSAESCSVRGGRKGPSFSCARAVTEASEVGTSTKSADVTLLDVEIQSDAGQDYEVLQRHLAAGEWELADQETRRLICVLAGEGAAKRKWVYFTEVQFIPQKDLLTIDRLWRSYSDDKFGYSVQRRIWNAFDKQWKPFFLKIEWTYGENSTYKKFPLEYSWSGDAPKGHLPLTNCLRGTQLLEKLLLHPAFAGFDEEQYMPDDSKLPDLIKKGDESSTTGSAASGETKTSPMGLTGSIFDEDFNSADYGF